MIQSNPEIEKEALYRVAKMMCLAARTAPKGRGEDKIVTAIVDGEEKDRITNEMARLGAEKGVAFFIRDAQNVGKSDLLVLFGTKFGQLGIPYCGNCGFKDCEENRKNNGICAFNTGDLGIAIGSAVSMAADFRADNRVMFTVGKAAQNLKILGEEVKLIYGVPLSGKGKNPFFDRT
ncbi:MAG: ferredoxin [Candidatus Tectomicrobia bacterium]|uniref:Ferredoxin n=1 Tax=Tectimicrobiota bacterium TaxID=2528274 RepID=A0A933GLU4_UNCTE|nr:ferredoxin [Candidatus Tectomicrobia bacterium]